MVRRNCGGGGGTASLRSLPSQLRQASRLPCAPFPPALAVCARLARRDPAVLRAFPDPLLRAFGEDYFRTTPEVRSFTANGDNRFLLYQLAVRSRRALEECFTPDFPDERGRLPLSGGNQGIRSRGGTRIPVPNPQDPRGPAGNVLRSSLSWGGRGGEIAYTMEGLPCAKVGDVPRRELPSLCW